MIEQSDDTVWTEKEAKIEETLKMIDREMFSETKQILRIAKALMKCVKAYVNNYNILNMLQ